MHHTMTHEEVIDLACYYAKGDPVGSAPGVLALVELAREIRISGGPSKAVEQMPVRTATKRTKGLPSGDGKVSFDND